MQKMLEKSKPSISQELNTKNNAQVCGYFCPEYDKFYVSPPDGDQIQCGRCSFWWH